MTILSTDRLPWTSLAIGLSAAVFISAGSLSAAERPNIVIVMADDN